MSWSFYAIGRPLGIIPKLRAFKITNVCCPYPSEEDVRQKACDAAITSLEAQHTDSVVNIKMSGYEQPVYSYSGQQTGRYSNALRVEIEPVAQFVDNPLSEQKADPLREELEAAVPIG